MTMTEPRFPVRITRGVPVVIAPGEIDITNAESAAGGPAPRRRPPWPGPGGRHDPDPVLRLSRQVRRILALTALDRLIPVCASLDQALAHPPAAPTRAAREQGR